MFKKNIDNLIIIINIIFFSYYAIQLLVFTDEFALSNLGFFNHAVAGLSEIIGIIFLSFALSFVTIIFRGLEKQSLLIYCIFIIQFLVSINFWRYVMTNSQGETNLDIISINAIFFSFVTFLNLLLIIKNFKNNLI